MDERVRRGVVRAMVMLVSAVAVLFVGTAFAVLWGALFGRQSLSDSQANILLVLGTGVLGLVGTGLGAYFGIQDQEQEQEQEQGPPGPVDGGSPGGGEREPGGHWQPTPFDWPEQPPTPTTDDHIGPPDDGIERH